MSNSPMIRGRGAAGNPPNRFETIAYEPEDEHTHAPDTVFLSDTSRSIVSTNDSPDVGFDASLNPYRGCEHGCVYCYARPTHEYLGFSSGLDFETKILVKEDAPELLRRRLSSPAWKPQVLAMSGVTDAYQPVERRLKVTRRCLEVLAEFRNPVMIITKNHLVTRDVDLLADLARHDAAAVFVSVTSLDNDLARVMEPRTSQPGRRLAAITALAEAGVPVGVLAAPVIPALNDHELPSIVSAVADAGAGFASYTILRLPYANKALFDRWLTQYFPDRKGKVWNRIRAIRGGRLNDSSFGSRMRGEGIFADQIKSMFTAACRKSGLSVDRPKLSTAAFRKSSRSQLSFFD